MCRFSLPPPPPPPPSGLATHQRLLAVDGRAGALGDDLVDALFVNGGVAL